MMSIKFPKAELEKYAKKIEATKHAFTPERAKDLGEAVVEKMKDLIAKGVSPVLGFGRFPAYSEKYPDNVRKKFPSKRKRPVNLYLSGKMLSKLGYKVGKNRHGATTEISFQSKSEEEKSEWNRDMGRPALPKGGERFVVTLENLIFKHFRNAISDAVKGK